MATKDIWDMIMEAAQTVAAPTFVNPGDDPLRTGGRVIGEIARLPRTFREFGGQAVDAVSNSSFGAGIRDALGQSSTSGNQASPLEVERANAQAAERIARENQAAHQNMESEARATAEALNLLNRASSKGTQTFVARGDKMLRGEGTGEGTGEAPGSYFSSKTKALDSADAKILKSMGLPEEFAVANPKVLILLRALKEAGVTSQADREASKAKARMDLASEVAKSQNTPPDILEELIYELFGPAFKANIDAKRKAREE